MDPAVKHRSLLLVTLLAASACGVTEPEDVLIVRGTVVAASDGGGFVQGQVIPDAQMTLRSTAPLTLSVSVRDDGLSDADGAWELQSGPPPQQSDPDCSTLSVIAVRNGFSTSTLRLSSLCGQGAGIVENIVIEMTPN